MTTRLIYNRKGNFSVELTFCFDSYRKYISLGKTDNFELFKARPDVVEYVNKCKGIANGLKALGHRLTPDLLAEMLPTFGDARRVMPANRVAIPPLQDFAFDSADDGTLKPQSLRHRYSELRIIFDTGLFKCWEDLTPKNIKRLDDYLNKRGISRTTIRNYHKTLKVTIRKGLENEYIKTNPYQAVKLAYGRPKERTVLSLNDIKKITTARLCKRLERVRDVFIFQCFTGLAYADVATLTPSAIVERHGRLFVDGKRVKTGRHYFTPMLPPAQKVYNKYNGQLPIISNQKYNDMLHEIESLCDIHKPMTSHVARHTFATTIALDNEIAITTLAGMLGHADIQTTMIYAKIHDNTIAKETDNLFAKF